jgi:dihydroxyacid dehydratase/phosphogluconate dehydratase
MRRHRVGSCPMMGTANTMSCLMEPLGLSLPGCGTVHATQADKLRYARNSGKQSTVRAGQRSFPLIQGAIIRR